MVVPDGEIRGIRGFGSRFVDAVYGHDRLDGVVEVEDQRIESVYAQLSGVQIRELV